jgi:hypothetical protein
MQTGGVYINGDYKEAFNDFMKNSKCELLTNTSGGGITFLLHLNNGHTSPYRMSRTRNENFEIKTILLKVCFIHETDHICINNKEYNKVTENDFKNELEIQQDIFNRSYKPKREIVEDSIFNFPINNKFEIIEQIAPSILYADLIENNESLKFIDELFKKATGQKSVNELIYIQNALGENTNFKCGIIAMELLDNFVTLRDFLETTQEKETKLMAIGLAMYEISRLFHLGYIHGDLHLGNIMINTEYDTYIPNVTGKASLIDFGATFRHDIDTFETYSRATTTQNYYDNYILPSATITSPVWLSHGHNSDLASSYSAWQWLQLSDEDKISINDILLRINNARPLVIGLRGGKIKTKNTRRKRIRRKNTQLKNTKRKNTKRKNTKRKNTKRKNNKRKNNKRKNNKRKNTKRNTDLPKVYRSIR